MVANELPSSAQAFQEQVLAGFVSRKLLSHNPLDHNTERVLTIAPSPLITHQNNFNGNVLILLSILICGIICCIGLHYIIRCAIKRSSRFMISEPIANISTPHGSSNKGIKKKVLRMFPVVSYSPEMNLKGLDEECVICLSDFVSGEKLRLLPKCNHGFHVRCIDKWLQQHLTCPKCRHCLVETCEKILGDSSPADQVTVTPTESVIVRIAPLEPEGSVIVRIAPLEPEGSVIVMIAPLEPEGSVIVMIAPLEPEGRVNTLRESSNSCL